MKKSKKRPFIILGRNIAERRDKAGLNQEDFATKVGTSLTGLKNIERGVAEGRFETRQLIAQYLKCSLADLYRAPEERSREVSFAADLLSMFSDLLPEAQAFVLALISGDDEVISELPPQVSAQLKNAAKARPAES